MRAPKRRRPQRREFASPPADVDLEALAERAEYVGSGEHKSYPSFAGPPKLRATATRCDPSLADQDELTGWLRDGIRKGQVGTLWEGDFPRYVWVSRQGTWYEGRLVNPGLGQYKGYALTEEQHPKGLP
jgi:hypothetical protein